MSRIPTTGSDDPRRIRASLQALTARTKPVTITDGTESFTIPADGSATTTTLNQFCRMLARVLDEKGILTVEEL